MRYSAYEQRQLDIQSGQELDRIAQRAARKVYRCTICGKNPVDAENGIDTCQECLANR